MSKDNGKETDSGASDEPMSVPVTDIRVAHGSKSAVLTLPGYLTLREVKKALRFLYRNRSPGVYVHHTWRDATCLPQPRSV